MSKYAMHALEMLFLLSLACPSSLVAADGKCLYIPPEDYVVDRNYDILVVRIVEVSDHEATRTNPPIVQLRVEETIRGKERTKLLRTKWEFPYDPDIVPPDRPPISEADRQRMREEAKRPVATPKLGTKWLVLGDMFSDKEGPFFYPYSKYSFTKEKRQWALDELDRGKQLAAERHQYQNTWPDVTWHSNDELRARARPVTQDAAIEVGQPILLNVATLWRCRVVEVLTDGRVKIRRSGYDSRWDGIESRDKLLLYPKDCLVPPKPLRDRYTEEDVKRYAATADFIGIGKISSEMLHGNSNLRDITFEIREILKGKAREKYRNGLYYVGVRVPRELHFLLRRGKLYLLFLSDDVKGITPLVYKRIPDDDVFVEADPETIDAVKGVIKKK